MFTILQRLILGCSLILAIVLGLGLSHRDTSRRLAAANDQVQTADRALVTLEKLLSSMRQEQVFELRAAAGQPGSQSAFAAQLQESQRLNSAASAALSALDPYAAGSLKAIAAQPSLEKSQAELQKLIAAESSRRDAIAGPALVLKEKLTRRIAYVNFAAFFGVLLVAVATILSVIRPLRQAAASARRIGQGDLQQRIEWRAQDALGTIGNEFNRMAVRLRDLRDTESGRREMEFQLSDAVLQSIFEPVIVTDAKGHVLKLNQASSDLLGDAANDRMALTTTPGGEKILDSVREAVSMQRAIANEGEAALLPMRIGKAQRSYRLRTTPMRDSEGKLLGTVTVLEDVTDLQDIDRFKTRFLAVASRKLRDPLEKLRLSVYTLARGYAGELRPLQADVVAGAEQEVERLSDLMTDLIDVAELDLGSRKLNPQNLRPLQILQEASDRFSDEAKKRDIEIVISCFADLSYVTADRRAVRTIFDNLMSNAIRFTPEGGAVRLEAEEGSDKVQFMVRDSGRGIEAERLPTIFGRFNTSTEGTGLGLALVRRLVETLGGQISVESRLGHGTTFRFTLPIATVAANRHPVEIG
jgi:two-component system, NtrC family, sensor histidine kinase KinB